MNLFPAKRGPGKVGSHNHEEQAERRHGYTNGCLSRRAFAGTAWEIAGEYVHVSADGNLWEKLLVVVGHGETASFGEDVVSAVGGVGGGGVAVAAAVGACPGVLLRGRPGRLPASACP